MSRASQTSSDTPIAATIGHHTRGRTRFSLPQLCRSNSQLESLVETLKACPMVQRIVANPVTGSLTLYYDGEFSGLATDLRERRILDFSDPPADFNRAAQKLSLAVGEATKKLDSAIYRASGGGADLVSVGFVTFLGLAFLQLKRGDFLPAGFALASQAFHLIRERRDFAEKAEGVLQ